MNKKIIKNDFLRNKTISIALSLFVAIAALLISLGAILSVNLLGGIDTLMTAAKTPHFVQMHAGDVDQSQLNQFVKETNGIDQFQTLEFLNIENADIMLGTRSLSNSTQDHGVSTQSKTFDFLLDLNGERIEVNDGELYVPICYMDDASIRIGEKAMISGVEFTIAGFLRDSQMNSMLSSSKRFLISEHDYEKLQPYGTLEYLIEFRLHEEANISAFESAYIASGLPSNGPTITYPLIKMLNAISEGIVIVLLFFVSILVVMISLLCIRFALLAKMEDDKQEIGVMKAIGLRNRDMKQLYLMSYGAITGIGCLLGYLSSFLFQGMLTENIRTSMGESRFDQYGSCLGFFGVVLIFITILWFIHHILKQFRTISAAQAMRSDTKKAKQKNRMSISQTCLRNININIILGIKEVWMRKGLYVTMGIIIMISTFIMIVPHNLYHTISARDFATYMGIGMSELRIDVQQSKQIKERTKTITDQLDQDERIQNYTLLTTKSFRLKTEDQVANIKIELGDHSQYPVSYAEGNTPVTTNEIALSITNAEELQKQVGDSLMIETSQGEKRLVVCGIYSDITNGGKTAKAVFEDNAASTMWSVVYASVNEEELQAVTQSYTKQFSFAKVTDIQDFISQTYGETVSMVQQGATIAIVVSIVIVFFVMLLFMNMLLAKDRYDSSVMKVFGFQTKDIRCQYISRMMFVVLIAMFLGIVLSNTLGEGIAGMAISSFGASSFKFQIDVLSTYLVCPIILICSVAIALIMSTMRIDHIKLSENIKE